MNKALPRSESRGSGDPKKAKHKIVTPDRARPLFTSSTMHASLIRRQLGGLVPPKIATPKLVVCILNL